MREAIITGIDVGSSKIRIIVGQVTEQGIRIIGLAEVDSDGISKGIINSVEDAVSSISQALEKAEQMTGIPLERALVSISGSHIISDNSKGVIAVAKADGEVKEDDIARAMEAAQAVATPPNYDILHVIPREFSVDSQTGVKDPVGMTGVRLEVNVQIIQGLSTQIKNLTKVVYRTGVDVSDLIVAGLASAEAILSKRQKELGAAVLNIGGATTSLSVFDEGDVMHTAVLPVGSSHLTSDLAIGLRTSIDTAEAVKLNYGHADPSQINRRDDLDLAEITEGETGVVSLHHIAEILEARVEEIFKLADKELIKIERSGKLPAGVVLTGGGAKLPGLIEVGRKIFRLPVSIGYPRNVSSAIDKINDPALSTAVGLVLWGYQLLGQDQAGRLGRSFSSMTEASDKLKKWFKGFLP